MVSKVKLIGLLASVLGTSFTDFCLVFTQIYEKGSSIHVTHYFWNLKARQLRAVTMDHLIKFKSFFFFFFANSLAFFFACF